MDNTIRFRRTTEQFDVRTYYKMITTVSFVNSRHCTRLKVFFFFLLMRPLLKELKNFLKLR